MIYWGMFLTETFWISALISMNHYSILNTNCILQQQYTSATLKMKKYHTIDSRCHLIFMLAALKHEQERFHAFKIQTKRPISTRCIAILPTYIPTSSNHMFVDCSEHMWSLNSVRLNEMVTNNERCFFRYQNMCVKTILYYHLYLTSTDAFV